MAQGHGIWRRAVDAVVAARMRQAESYVNGALLALDDKTLSAHGYNRAELQKARHAHYF